MQYLLILSDKERIISQPPKSGNISKMGMIIDSFITCCAIYNSSKLDPKHFKVEPTFIQNITKYKPASSIFSENSIQIYSNFYEILSIYIQILKKLDPHFSEIFGCRSIFSYSASFQSSKRPKYVFIEPPVAAPDLQRVVSQPDRTVEIIINTCANPVHFAPHPDATG